jgi:hypothetical protein
MAEDFRQPLLLMKRFGFSEETAFGMSPSVRMACFVVDGEDQGLTFDWKAGCWVKP